jgi:hypothetical protein
MYLAEPTVKEARPRRAGRAGGACMLKRRGRDRELVLENVTFK